MGILVVLFLGLLSVCSGAHEDECEVEPDPGFFFCFAYSSNLLPTRMRMSCKSAKHCSAAKLQNYRLNFNMKCPRWDGALATIVEDNTTSIWGNVWQISVFESTKLAEQEGVTRGLYYPKEVEVTMKNGKTVTARVYIDRHPPLTKQEPEMLPPERQPSTTYHQVLMLGAIQSRLPVSYLHYLLRFPTNGRISPSLMREDLGYPFYDSSFAQDVNQVAILCVLY